MQETHVPAAEQAEHPVAVVARPSRWTAGRITALAIGSLLVLVSLALLGAGGTGLWADRTQREGGFAPQTSTASPPPARRWRASAPSSERRGSAGSTRR